jgi:glycosyltransferase involved in cell wall biosynthesis
VTARNEAATIDQVVRALLTCKDIDEIIVVDDCSLDGTADAIDAGDVLVLRNERHLGKGASMDRAVEQAHGDVLCFVDADLIGLTAGHVSTLVEPVVRGAVDMHIGMRWTPWYRSRITRAITPKLGGERAMVRAVWQSVGVRWRRGYRIEAALNNSALVHGYRTATVLLPGLTHRVKERKYGKFRGMLARASMIIDVAIAYLLITTTGGAR